MALEASVEVVAKLDALMNGVIGAARIPGAALAIVAGGKTVYANGFGYRDHGKRKPLLPDTVYPIASTTKPINATLLGMLVDEGRLEWDAPVQRFLPRFRLYDAAISSRVTVRDLVTMRTGLPRHDWVWWGSPASREQLVERLAHLEPCADFRQRFQYNNLTTTAAGHVAEVVAGTAWETLVRQRVFAPLAMRRTGCVRPTHRNVTLSYHENERRRLVQSRCLTSEATAPSGGAVYSTVTDMARWLLFNLNQGKVNGRALISAGTLAQIHTPQVVIGDHALVGMPAEGAYGLGWLVDYYNGRKRISHTGYLHDVNSAIAFFPQIGVGMVSFVNFGCARLAALINQCAFDTMMSLPPVQTIEQRLAEYEAKIASTRKRNLSLKRVNGTNPSHSLDSYSGTYAHPGYGEINIEKHGRKLFFHRHGLLLALRHWHYDVWVAEEDDMWPIHESRAFDLACQIDFHTDSLGAIASVSIPLEPEVSPICFVKNSQTRGRQVGRRRIAK